MGNLKQNVNMLCVYISFTHRAYLRLIFISPIYAAECPLMSHLQTADYWFRIYSFNPVTLEEDKSVSPQTSAHTHGFIYVYPRTSQATLWERFTNLMEGQLMHLDDYIQNHIERFFWCNSANEAEKRNLLSANNMECSRCSGNQLKRERHSSPSLRGSQTIKCNEVVKTELHLTNQVFVEI